MHLHTIEREVVSPFPQTAELVTRSRNGDAEAFRALYDEHVGVVYALCARLGGQGEAAAMEMTQEVFVRAWKGLGGFRGEASFATWLHRIALNVARDAQRGDSRRRARLVEVDAAETDFGLTSPRGLDEESRIDLERAIARLPEKARNALVLHDIHGYRCHEVAALTGTAVGTIQAHLHRARRLLRKFMER